MYEYPLVWGVSYMSQLCIKPFQIRLQQLILPLLNISQMGQGYETLLPAWHCHRKAVVNCGQTDIDLSSNVLNHFFAPLVNVTAKQ